jgi:hypothetical protein
MLDQTPSVCKRTHLYLSILLYSPQFLNFLWNVATDSKIDLKFLDIMTGKFCIPLNRRILEIVLIPSRDQQEMELMIGMLTRSLADVTCCDCIINWTLRHNSYLKSDEKRMMLVAFRQCKSLSLTQLERISKLVSSPEHLLDYEFLIGKNVQDALVRHIYMRLPMRISPRSSKSISKKSEYTTYDLRCILNNMELQPANSQEFMETLQNESSCLATLFEK